LDITVAQLVHWQAHKSSRKQLESPGVYIYTCICVHTYTPHSNIIVPDPSNLYITVPQRVHWKAHKTSCKQKESLSVGGVGGGAALGAARALARGEVPAFASALADETSAKYSSAIADKKAARLRVCTCI